MIGPRAMEDIAKAPKIEIAGGNRKEGKEAAQGIGKTKPNQRKLVADLRRRVFVLERENKRLMATIRKLQVDSVQKPGEQ